jgi:hypothetical protein
VLPLLRHTRLHRRAASFLKWEAIVNDPIGAILAALVLQILIAHPQSLGWTTIAQIMVGLAVALGLGGGAALLVRWCFQHDQAPEVLKTPILLALAMGVYVLSNLTMDDAGLMAATMFGVTLANLRVPGVGELRRFKESLVVLVVSALFITLTSEISRDMLRQLSWPVMALSLTMMLLVRPVAILLATSFSSLSWPERLLPAWIAPRGIVAAAVAGVAGQRLHMVGYPGAEQVMPSVFALIAATMILHGFSLRPVATHLGLTLGNLPGIGIVGACSWTIQLAHLLQQQGVPVLLIDTFPGALDPARALDIPVLQAEILSDHGREELEGRPVDYLIAATEDDIYNGLVCTRLAPEIGRERVFQLAPAGGRHDEFRGLSRDWRGKIWGQPPMDFRHFARRFDRGWRFTMTTFEEDLAAMMLTIRPNGQLIFSSPEDIIASDAAEDNRTIRFSLQTITADNNASPSETV